MCRCASVAWYHGVVFPFAGRLACSAWVAAGAAFFAGFDSATILAVAAASCASGFWLCAASFGVVLRDCDCV
jgi:hypothetical protein